MAKKFTFDISKGFVEEKKTKPKDCPECCGEGFDLDTFYETDGEEEDCYMCGGTGKE
jgi:DnaJ-class molecular chaperone